MHSSPRTDRRIRHGDGKANFPTVASSLSFDEVDMRLDLYPEASLLHGAFILIPIPPHLGASVTHRKAVIPQELDVPVKLLPDFSEMLIGAEHIQTGIGVAHSLIRTIHGNLTGESYVDLITIWHTFPPGRKEFQPNA